MEQLTESQVRSMNERYRDVEPSDLHEQAFRDVLTTGSVSDEQRTQMVDRLYEPFSDKAKEMNKSPADNELMKTVERGEYAIKLSVSDKLFHQQPIGVLLRPINDEVRKAGEALITKLDPYGEDVEPHVMPHYHYKLTIAPLPLWMEMWVGENGYPTV